MENVRTKIVSVTLLLKSLKGLSRILMNPIYLWDGYWHLIFEWLHENYE